MRKRLTPLAALAAAALVVPVVGLAPSSVAAPSSDAVCAPLDSGKIDVRGELQAVTPPIKPGKLITGYCVKAGSVNQGNGPAYRTLPEPVPTYAISHPSGKAVSHYSLSYINAAPAPTTPAPTTPAPTELGPVAFPEIENEPAVDSSGNFDWNWKYADPSCYGLFVAYPSNIPDGQSNDINVRVWTDTAGEITLNYHNNETTWSGNQEFAYSQHKNWPAGVREYAVIWTQVAGSNYHYGEKFHQEPAKAPLTCRINDDGDAETYDLPQAVSDIEGWRTSTLTVRKGATAPAARVTVEWHGLQAVALQRYQAGRSWSTVKQVTPGSRTTTVTFPKEKKKGTYRYRLVLPGTETTTGATTKAFTVRVR